MSPGWGLLKGGGEGAFLPDFKKKRRNWEAMGRTELGNKCDLMTKTCITDILAGDKKAGYFNLKLSSPPP